MKWFCTTVDILILVFLNDKISIKYWIIVLPNFNFIVIPFSYQRSNFFHDTMKYEYSEKNYERASN